MSLVNYAAKYRRKVTESRFDLFRIYDDIYNFNFSQTMHNDGMRGSLHFSVIVPKSKMYNGKKQ
jgi:hypothetical protein